MTERDAMIEMLAELLGVSRAQAVEQVRERMASLPGLAPPLRAAKARRDPASRDAERWLRLLNEGLASIHLPELAGLTASEESKLLDAMRRLGRDDMLAALAGAFRCHRRCSLEERNTHGHLWRTVDHYVREANHRRYVSAAQTTPATTTRPPTEMLR